MKARCIPGSHRVDSRLSWRPCSRHRVDHRVDPQLSWPPGGVEAIASESAERPVSEGVERRLRVGQRLSWLPRDWSRRPAASPAAELGIQAKW